jgi:hypothetical protein
VSSVADINRPEVVEEVTKVFLAYEDALMANDVEAMGEAFWDSPLTTRYGINERLYGADEIAAWRRAAIAVPPGRRIGPTVVSTFGADFACVSTEFRNPSNPAMVGRQTQTWVRMDGTWLVVAAHVSLQATT